MNNKYIKNQANFSTGIPYDNKKIDFFGEILQKMTLKTQSMLQYRITEIRIARRKDPI